MSNATSEGVNLKIGDILLGLAIVVLILVLLIGLSIQAPIALKT